MKLYQKYFDETIDANGRLIKAEAHWPDNFNFGYDVVDAFADAEPQKRALVWCNTDKEEHIFSFADIKRESCRAANVLINAGIKKGDRVILALKRHYEYWPVSVAVNKIGAVMIPVTHMLTEDDFAYRINSADVKAVICTPFNDVPERVLGAVEKLGRKDMMKLWTVKQDVEGFENMTTACLNASEEFARRETNAEDPMMIYFTSGTSGSPKGVVHNFTYPLSHFVTAKYWQEVEEDGLHFTISETGWAKASWGKIYGQWLLGCAVFVYDFDNFEPKQVSSVLNQYGVTSFCAPPTVYRYLTRKNAPKIPSVKSAGTAGEYLDVEVFKKFKEQTGIRIHEAYGQTESSLVLANFKGMEPKDGSLGQPSPMYEVALLDKQGNPVEDNVIGEICIMAKNGKRPLGVFCAYLDNDEKYNYVWRNGYYHTGDAAWRDEDGYYWFHGRFDDIIKSGGYRIGPYEIEKELIKHPAVAECSVVGVPDKLRGQAIKAYVVLMPGYEKTNDLKKEILGVCNAELAEYKWARYLEFVDEMPKTISGKIKKAELRARNKDEGQPNGPK